MPSGAAEEVWRFACEVSETPIQIGPAADPSLTLFLNSPNRLRPASIVGTGTDVKTEVATLLAKAKLSVELPLDPASWCLDSNIEKFVEETQAANKGAKSTKLTKCIKALDNSAGVFNAFLQQPFEAALVWGTLRFIIQVASADITVAEKLSEALSDVLQRIPCWNLESETFARRTEVQQALRTLFGRIIVLLFQARIHVLTPKLKRFVRSAFSAQFQDTLGAIERSTRILDHWLRQTSFDVNAKFHIDIISRVDDNSKNTKNIETLLLQTMMMDPKPSIIERCITQDDRLKICLQWVEKSVRSLKPITPPTPGTCQWIYGVQKWKVWSASASTGGLLITGPPGSGKSVLAGSMVKKARSNTSEYVLHFSFGAATAETTKTATGFVIYSLHNLLQESSITDRQPFRSVLHQLTVMNNTYQNVQDCPLEYLLDVLEKAFDTVPDLMLIVDALDECSENIPSLSEFLARVSVRPRKHVVILTRGHLRLSGHLQKFEQIEIDTECTKLDIEVYVDEAIACRPALQLLKVEIRKSVLLHAKGNFLQAKLMLEDVEKYKIVGLQKKRMAAFADTLAETYENQLTANEANLTIQELERQREIFLVVIGAKAEFTPDEIYKILLLRADTDTINEDERHVAPADEIIRLCQPLLTIGPENTVQIIHATAREYLLRRRISLVQKDSLEEADLYLARKTLSQLTQAYYRRWKTSAALLRRHLLAGTPYSNGNEAQYEDEVLYNYAVQHFHEHVTSLRRPPEDVVAKLSRFLRGTEFVTWSEVLFDLNKQSDLGTQVLVFKKLLLWTKLLPPTTQVEIPLEDFFEVPHEHLSAILKEQSEDNILQYLPFVRLGDYYNLGGQTLDAWRKAYDYKKELVRGVTDLLGARNQITLRWRDSMLREYFWQKRFDEVYVQSREVADLQRSVFNGESFDLYVSLEMVAGALYCLTRFEESIPIFNDISAGIKKIRGNSHPQYFMNEFFQGMSLEQLNDFSTATSLYEDIIARYIPIVGLVNPFGLAAQATLGSLQRKQGKLQLAEQNLVEAYGGRKQLFSIDVNVCLDSAVQLALLWRDFGDKEHLVNAIELLDSVCNSRVYKEDFERKCQTYHIRALVKLDTGNYEEAKKILFGLLKVISGSEGQENNRELMWVRCTLADALRHYDEGSDASQLFEDLVESVEKTPPSSPSITEGMQHIETRSQLRIAEEALRLVKAGQRGEAQALLERNKYRWAREKDFWILGQGGPVPDTARIRPVNFDTPVIVDGAT